MPLFAENFRCFTVIFSLFSMFYGVGAGADTASEKPKNTNVAHVRILHAIAGAPAADFYFDDKKIAETVNFKSLGEYQEIPSGKTNIKMTAAGGVATILDGAATFSRDGFYTIAPFGTMDKAKLTVQNDNTGKGDEKKARVRVFHLAPGAAELSFAFVAMLSNDKKPEIINDLEYGADTTKLIEPGALILQVGSGEKVVYEMPRVKFEAGKRYAIFAVGKPNVPGPQAFELIVQTMGSTDEKL